METLEGKQEISQEGAETEKSQRRTSGEPRHLAGEEEGGFLRKELDPSKWQQMKKNKKSHMSQKPREEIFFRRDGVISVQ